jgi:restriction system protein
MARESLFAVLTRQPWWLSVAIAAGLFGALQVVLPAIVAASAALPFVAIAGYVGWRRLRVPGEGAVAERMDELRQMSWENFRTLMAEAFRRDGYEVAELTGGTADYELRRDGRVTLAACKRWKVAQTGVGPLRELLEARDAREADECVYVAAGDFTPQAQAFAATRRVRLLESTELAQMIRRVPRPRDR